MRRFFVELWLDFRQLAGGLRCDVCGPRLPQIGRRGRFWFHDQTHATTCESCYHRAVETLLAAGATINAK